MVSGTRLPLPVTAETLFSIGSISKTFTATAVMALVEKGLLDLDTPVRKYIPDFQLQDEGAARAATVSTLLTHMGGWEGEFAAAEYGSGDDALRRTVQGMVKLKQITPVHTRWSYNNAGFYVAARLIEVVTGKTFEAALRELVFAPLSLQNTYLSPEEIITYRFAVGHNLIGSVPRVVRPFGPSRGTRGAAAVITSVSDLLKYAKFQLGQHAGNTPVLDASLLRRMHKPVVQRIDEVEQMALSWFSTTNNGLQQLWHEGNVAGQTASLTLIPSSDFAVLVLTNASTGPALYREANRAAIRKFLRINHDDPTVDPRFANNLNQLVGHYSTGSAKLIVRASGTELMVSRMRRQQPAPAANADVPERFAFYAPDRLVCVEGPGKGGRMEILRKEDGSVGWVRHSNRLHTRDER